MAASMGAEGDDGTTSSHNGRGGPQGGNASSTELEQTFTNMNNVLKRNLEQVGGEEDENSGDDTVSQMKSLFKNRVAPHFVQVFRELKRVKCAILEKEAAEKLKDLDPYAEKLTELMEDKMEKEARLKNMAEELEKVPTFVQKCVTGNPLEEIEQEVSQATALLKGKWEEAKAEHATIVGELRKTSNKADRYTTFGKVGEIIVKTPDTAKKNCENRLKYATWEAGALNGKQLDFD